MPINYVVRKKKDQSGNEVKELYYAVPSAIVLDRWFFCYHTIWMNIHVRYCPDIVFRRIRNYGLSEI